MILFLLQMQLTVRQFKERIQEKTGVEAELQRLIYCGRVMNDEHPLTDYSMHFSSEFVSRTNFLFGVNVF